VLAPCVLAYPFSATSGYGNQDPVKGTPHTLTQFLESEYLRAFAPQGVVSAQPGENIQVFFNDEHAMTLGIRQVTVKTSGSTTTSNFGITASPSPAACKNPVLVGDTNLTGDLAGADPAGRPIWPALFITDITSDAAACQPGDTGTCCDWQAVGTSFASACNGSGEAVIPTEVCGVWKSAVRTVDKTKNPTTITVTPDADPSKNNWVLGAGSDPLPPAYCPPVPVATPCPPGPPCPPAPPAPPACQPGSVPTNQGYGAEVKWSIDGLKAANVLQAGHIYRFQFMGHDGDQNKTGGDVGEACVNIAVP